MIRRDERLAMVETVRAAIAEAATTRETDIDAVLAKLKWVEMLDEEPDDAIEIVFGALGTGNATATALDDVMTWALGEVPRPDLAVVLPRFSEWSPPGQIDAGDLRAEGLATNRAAVAREMLIVCGTNSEPWSVIVAATTGETRAVRGIDPDAGLRRVRVHGAVAGARRLDAAVWQSAVALGRRAVAYQIEGACRAMLDLARVHALERVQFGRPIARFQAVRHRLAEVLVAVEALESALLAAREESNPDTAALAKAVAGRAAQTAARHCQQVLAGIGFTTEHAFHRFFKRTLALEGLFGSADEIVLQAGRRLLAERRVPILIDL
jgi:hypothetical protein